MHELSIANSIVEVATEHAKCHGASAVKTVTLRIGALSCVHPSSLEFCFELVAKDTLLEGAELRIVEVPVAVYCQSCRRIVELPTLQPLRCPDCKTPSSDVRQGRELDIESLEVIEVPSVEAAS